MRAKTIAALWGMGVVSAWLFVGEPTVRAQIQDRAQTQGSAQTEDQPAEPLQKMGRGVTPPRVIHQVEPEFSEQARAAHYQGTCVLKVVVGVDGTPHHIRVVNPIGMGLDEKAVEAVRTWRFEPARKDGEPVAVEVAVEVDFHLYTKDDPKIAELRQRANAGDAKAQLELAIRLLEGRDAPRDPGQGLVYLEKAARQGMPRAQFLMGENASQGASPDYAKAYLWYTLAHRNGYKHSDKALRELSAKMTPEQLQAGQALADNWTNAPPR